MITVKNRKRFENVPFEDYLKMDGYSFSFLNKERFGVAPEVTETEAMRVGSLVDAILTEPHKADMSSELYDYCRSIAFNIKKQIPQLKLLKKQISYTADFEWSGFTLPVRGRLDFEIPEVLTLDLKVTGSTSLDAIIKHMNYEEQVNGYSMMADNKQAFICAYLKPVGVVELRSIPVNYHSDFWKDKILKFGYVKTE